MAFQNLVNPHMISKTIHFTKLNFGRSLQVLWKFWLVSIVTDLCAAASQPNFAKETSENDQSSDAWQSFRIDAKAVKLF